ncbi:hypothetical protein ACFP2T_35845 [Plantactinospora solaniradicis]|uniref:Uncharacterized protein n=1 Tax=Plantactinospora solaniradicis TaxID=1723736 RepID=A0ABW1KL08_9ACTN
MSYSVEDLDRVIEGTPDDDWYVGWDAWWNNFYPHDQVQHTELGSLRVVDSYGGEGEGDEFWVVISITDGAGAVRYFKRLGWYQSYGDGGHLDGPTVEVAPVTREVTFYE